MKIHVTWLIVFATVDIKTIYNLLGPQVSFADDYVKIINCKHFFIAMVYVFSNQK